MPTVQATISYEEVLLPTEFYYNEIVLFPLPFFQTSKDWFNKANQSANYNLNCQFTAFAP